MARLRAQGAKAAASGARVFFVAFGYDSDRFNRSASSWRGAHSGLGWSSFSGLIAAGWSQSKEMAMKPVWEIDGDDVATLQGNSPDFVRFMNALLGFHASRAGLPSASI